MWTLSIPTFRPFVNAALRPLTATFEALGRAWRQHRDRRELATLSDESLRDIGLTRSDINRELMAPFWQPLDYDTLETQRRRNAGCRLCG